MLELGVLIVFGAIVCAVLGLAWREESPLNARIASLRGEAVAGYDNLKPPRESLTSRVFLPMAQTMGGNVQRYLPTRWVEGIGQRLVQAGQPVTTSGFLIAWMVAIGVGVLFGFTMLTAGHTSGMTALILGGGPILMSLIMPKIWLDNRIRHRQKEILKSLPDAFDLITTCVEAGLGLDAALARVAEKVEGPFGEELALALREVSLGKLRREALKELTLRAAVPDLVAFINAVIQAETMGTSIAQVLRVQAEQMRIRRRQRAEQQAYQAPVKMIFPLVLCIFPTLFIIILGPAGITLYHQLVAK